MGETLIERIEGKFEKGEVDALMSAYVSDLHELVKENAALKEALLAVLKGEKIDICPLHIVDSNCPEDGCPIYELIE